MPADCLAGRSRALSDIATTLRAAGTQCDDRKIKGKVSASYSWPFIPCNLMYVGFLSSGQSPHGPPWRTFNREACAAEVGRSQCQFWLGAQTISISRNRQRRQHHPVFLYTCACKFLFSRTPAFNTMALARQWHACLLDGSQDGHEFPYLLPEWRCTVIMVCAPYQYLCYLGVTYIKAFLYSHYHLRNVTTSC